MGINTPANKTIHVEQRRVAGVVLRIILLATAIDLTAYAAVTPSQLRKVPAETAAVGVAGAAMAVQVCVTLARYLRRLPYAASAVVALDALCAASWMAVVAVLSYWDRSVAYRPRDGDPEAWFACASARDWDPILTSDGYAHWINIHWCEVEVDGRRRIIGNHAARQQLHVLIGLSAVALFFTGWILFYMIMVGKHHNLFRACRRTRRPAGLAQGC